MASTRCATRRVLQLLLTLVVSITAAGVAFADPPRPNSSAPAARTTPSPSVPWKVGKLPAKHFRSCNEVVVYLMDPTHYAANDNCYLESDWTPDGGEFKQDPGTKKWRASQTAKSYMNPDQSGYDLPDWSWDNMSDKERKALDRFLKDLEVHEQGHMAVCQELAKKYSKTLSSRDFETREKAGDNLVKLREAFEDEKEKAVTDTEGEYEKVTDHGRRQADGPSHQPPYPGGQNVVLDCSDKRAMLIQWHDTSKRPYPNGEMATYYTVQFKVTDNAAQKVVATWSEEVRVPGGHTHYGCMGSKLVDVNSDEFPSLEATVEYLRRQVNLEFTSDHPPTLDSPGSV